MFKKLTLILLTLMTLLIFTACEDDPSFYVYDTTRSEIVTNFLDYIGLNGFNISYSNRNKGLYRVDTGSVFVPEKTTTRIQTAIITQNYFKSGKFVDTKKTTKTRAGYYQTVAFAIQIIQNRQNVIVRAISYNDMYSAEDVRKFIDELNQMGYRTSLIQAQPDN